MHSNFKMKVIKKKQRTKQRISNFWNHMFWNHVYFLRFTETDTQKKENRKKENKVEKLQMKDIISFNEIMYVYTLKNAVSEAIIEVTLKSFNLYLN